MRLEWDLMLCSQQRYWLEISSEKFFAADLKIIRPNKMAYMHAKRLSYGFCRTTKVINTNVININNLMDYGCVPLHIRRKDIGEGCAPPLYFLLLRLFIIFNRMQNGIHALVHAGSSRSRIQGVSHSVRFHARR